MAFHGIRENMKRGIRMAPAVRAAFLFLGLAAGAARAEEPNRLASAFAVADGHWVVTARHVVEGQSCVAIADGAPRADATGTTPAPLTWEPAQVVASNARYDLALLRIERPRPPLAIADGASVPVGLEALAIGYPVPLYLGFSPKVTRGLVAGMPERGAAFGLLEFSAPIQLGNSGGPVVSPDGTVIGMVRARLEPGAFGKELRDAPQLVNFAVNATTLNIFLKAAGVTPRIVTVDSAAADPPALTFRRASPSVMLVAAGNWRGKAHPVIAGQSLPQPLDAACRAG